MRVERRRRWVSGLAVTGALLALAGCGQVEPGERAGAGGALPLEPAPPIEAVDEPAPESLFPWTSGQPIGESGGTVWLCIHSGTLPGRVEDYSDEPQFGTRSEVEPDCSEGEPAEAAGAEDALRGWLESIEPAGDSRMRTVAQLPLTSGRTAHLVAWRNRTGQLCMASYSRDGREVTDSDVIGPWGPCLVDGEPECDAVVCMSFSDGCGDDICVVDRTAAGGEVVVGVVPTAGDRLHVVLRSGETRVYPLRGPVVREFPDKRVFMAELGRDGYRALEVFDGERLVARSELSEPYLRMLECIEQLEADGSDADWEDDDRRLRQCLDSVLPDLDGGEQDPASDGD